MAAATGGTFKLSENFLKKYKRKKPPFGFNGLGELVYMRTYSRIKDDGKNEVWWETVKRVVEGTYNMQMRHIEGHSLGWNPWKSQRSAQEMYDRIFNLKFTPPGRGLWMGGTDYVLERGVEMGLFNCSFVSTEFIDKDLTMPFCFLMDASMLGVGVGFDVKGEGKVLVKGFNSKDPLLYVIPDSREGWVESVRLLIDHIINGKEPVEFDYSEIRGAGAPIKGFGGVSSGPGPLKDLHIDLLNSFNDNVGLPITITTIVDAMNMIGKCVVSGNVRRTAELALGPPDSDEYLDLKNYEMNPNRESFGWTSNNSILAELGMDYGPAAERIKANGEPGFLWLENVRAYSRIRNGKDWKDSRAIGTNPCVEQSLEHAECCCLVETFPENHDSLEDYLKTLKYAYLYGKTVTLAKTHWPETNRVMLRNRRIGLSLSGITQFVTDRGLDVLREWCEKGYEEVQRLDKIYSDWMAIPKSIKTTSVKPSGSVSLLAGATPGVHYPESRFYIRRMRLSAHSKLIPNLEKAGYRVEPAVQGIDTVIVEVPVDVGEGIKTLKDVTIWEQLSLAAFMQKYWADNQVSCTVTFDPETEGDEIEAALNFFQYQLKGISFLPRHEVGAYAQMPYEAIDEETYNERLAELGTLSFRSVKGHEAVPEKFCTNDVCEIPTS